MKVVRLSALRIGRLYAPGNIPGTHLCKKLSQSRGHSAAERIMSTKNASDTIGNRTRDRFVAQCLNKLRHRVPHIYLDITLYPNAYILQLTS